MNIPYRLLSDSWYLGAAGLYALLLFAALWRAPWRRFHQSEIQHVFLGSVVGLLALWHITTTHFPGLDYHYIGATLLTLMFGWRLALLAFSLVYLGMMLNGESDWQALPLNVLLMGAVPILFSQTIYRLVDRYLPNNFFVYLFLNAFFGAGLAMVSMVLAATAVLVAGGAYRFEQLASDFLPFIPLMAFPESFITGMLVAIMVVMVPNWVCTFDDLRYLRGK